MATKIVTDSTADLPSELAKKLGITVVPLNVQFGEDTFLDGIDMHPDEFFQRLATEKQLPTTSQPSPGKFIEAYKPLVDAGHDIISIHVSDKLSGTLNSARQAKEQFKNARIELIDSEQVTLSLGLIVLAASAEVKKGAKFDAVIEEAKNAAAKVKVLGLLDTIEYLKKGGRIGKVKGFVGSILKVRPIITAVDGLVHSATSVRSRSAGLQYMLTIAEEHAPLARAGVLYSTTPEEAEELVEKIRPLVSDGEVVLTRVGPVIGTHAGPGVIGLAVQSENAP